MSSARGRAALVGVPLAVLLAVLAVLAGLGSGSAAAAAGDDYAADRVVVVGVPGLAWSDVTEEQTPELWALAEESPIGAMSVRAARSTTCLLDGWGTLGAGNRARFPGAEEPIPPVPLPTVPLPEDTPADPADATATPSSPGAAPEEPAVDASLSHCGLQEQVAGLGLTEPETTVQRMAEDEATRRFGADPAALGSAVGCAGVVGKAATVAVAAPGVELTVEPALPGGPALATLLGGCELTLVSLDQLTDAGRPGPEETDLGTEPERRATALRAVDSAIGRLRGTLAELPGRSLLLVQGISEVNDGRPQLHVAVAAGPGFTSAGWLTSASTGRAPYVQLIDVAPTVLRALDRAEPASMNGQPMQADGPRPPLAQAITQLDRASTAAAVHYRSTGTFFRALVFIGAGVVALGMLTLGGWRIGRFGGALPALRGPGGRRVLRVAAVAAAALPIATYLAGLVPWERAGSPGPALLGAVVLADVVVAAIALAGPWRRRPLGPPLAVLAVTLATLVGDVVTGSHLELDGLLGYDAIVAGRFTGYGNLTFGLLSVSALLLTAAVATAAGRRAAPGRSRAVVAGTVLGLGLLTVAVIGAPMLGRDFGGVLAGLPGFLLLAMLLTRTRVTWARLLLILGAAVVAVSVIAYLDWLRPADQRTHLGRFVEQVLTGEAWTVISRKAGANVDILLGSPLAWLLPVALVAAVWLVRPGGLLRGGGGGLGTEDAGVLKAGLLACALSLADGAAANDSGVALPATAAALLVPLLVWLAAAAPGGGTGSGEAAGRVPRPGPVEGADRVTVGSRGSTVWHA
jgi:hypothetical protein